MSSHWKVIKKEPIALLRPFIIEYSFRRVRVPAGQVLIQEMPVWCQTTIDFFLGDNVVTVDNDTGRTIPFSRCLFRGLRTHKKNHLELKGEVTVFIIRFTPIGFYNLLGIPANLFKDEVIDGTLVNKILFGEIAERLMPCADIESCITIVEPYLLKLGYHAEWDNRPSGCVNQMVRLMSTEKVPISVKWLQSKVSLSQRQLERNFLKEIGTTPKHYSRMLRFTNLVYLKMEQQHIKWAALAYEFNYTDQMHLINDFKYFLGITPSQFNAENYACFEEKPLGGL